MSIYSVDHTQGKHGRDAVLVDNTGTATLRLNGAEVVLDDRGKTGWYLRPPLVGSMFNGRIIDLRRMKNAAAGRSLHPATVHKEPLHQVFIVDVHEPELGAMSFESATPSSAPDPIDGTTPPDGSVWDLLVDGRPAIRHWFTLGPEYALASSRFETYETTVALPDLVMLCCARYFVWRPRRAPHGPQWVWD
jgi:hypothetical protein